MQLVGEQLDRALEEDRFRAGQVDQVRGMRRHRVDAVLVQATPEGGQLGRGRGPSRPGRRVVGEDLAGALAPISWARSAALTMPSARGRWAPRRRPWGACRGIVRCPTWMSSPPRSSSRTRTTSATRPSRRRSCGRSSATGAWCRSDRARNGARSSTATFATRSSPRTDRTPEKEVNQQRLALFHPDVATIRRGMVDSGLGHPCGGGVSARIVRPRGAAVRNEGRYRRRVREPLVYSPPTRSGSMIP